MGDSNCRYTRDNLEEWVFNTVNNYTDANGLQPYQVRDPWVDFQWYGVPPKLGSPSRWLVPTVLRKARLWIKYGISTIKS